MPKPTTRRKKDENKRTPFWKIFDRIMIVDDDSVKRKCKQCKFCKSILVIDPNRNMTSNLTKTCKVQKKDNNEDKNQTKLNLKST